MGAIAIPNVANALNRKKQNQTMADIRTVSTALEARATDFNEYPVVRSLDELAPLIEPTYVKQMPRFDGWHKPFRYESWRETGQAAATHYAFSSAGSDGRFEKPSARDYDPSATTTFERDIVFSNGAFIQYAEGT